MRTIDCRVRLPKKEETQWLKQAISSGAVIVYPTETLYGIGASPLSRSGIERVFHIKERPISGDVSIAFLSVEHAEEWVEIPEEAKDLMLRHTPGPLTVLVPRIMKKDMGLPEFPTMGIRIPSHPVSRHIIEAAGPILSTSANRHGHPPSIEEAMAIGELSDALVLAEGVAGTPSTVVLFEYNAPAKIIRQGAVNIQEQTSNMQGV